MSPSFKILGPLEVVDDATGAPLELGGPKPRAVLALLLLAGGEVVPISRIVEGLWGDEPPASAQGTLQAYVSNLRRVLEPDRSRPTVLVTQAPGYRLDVDPEDVDALRFTRALDEGRAALDDGRPDAAGAVLEDALAMWRGPALGELAYERFVEADVGRLEELRLQALEAWAEARLATGHAAEVAADLAVAVAEHPLRPRLRAHLMVALYRSGRQAEALRTYQEGRAVLRRELGADPEPELRDLEDRILRQDPGLDWRPPSTDEPAPRRSADAGGEPSVDSGPVLVGRDAEVAALDAALVSASSGTGAVVLVAGEAGIGKTRLAEAFAARADARAATVAWGRSFESEGAPAFWPWVEVLRQAFAGVGEAGAVLRDVGADAGLLVRLLPELAAVAPASPDTGEAADEALRFSLYGAVTRALAALAARRPVVVVLDDVHWADAASLRRLRFLAPHVPWMRVVVVVTFRDAEVGGELAEALATLARQEGVTRVELSGLSEGDVGRLLAAALDAPPPDPLVRDIAERSAGNPFFVGELARLLEGPGAVASDDVPPGVRDVIRRRIERLPDGADRLLAAAAVVGREFDLSIAARVADLDPDDDATLDLVDAAVGAHLLAEGARIGRYRFTHALVQDALRTGLSALRRARMHDRIAQALASSARTTGRAEDLAALAFHALEGADVGDAGAALRHAVDAAAAALAALSFEEAAALCSLALAVMDRTGAGDESCRFVLLLDLGIARRRQGDLDGSRAALRDALASARVLDDADRFAEAALAFGGGAWWGWWSDVGFADAEAVAAFEEALERLGPEPSERRTEVLGRLAVELHFDDGAAARRDDLSAEAMTMARRLGDPRALVHALAARHVAVWRAGNAGERRVLADELVATARTIRAREPEAFGHHFLFLAALERGDIAGARAQLEEGERLVRTLPLPHLTAQVVWSRSMLAAMAGRFAEAEALQAEALATTSAWSEAEAFRTWSAQLAALRWDQGRGGELAEPLRQLVAREAININWKTGLALLLADAGEIDEAAAWFDEVAAASFTDVPFDLGRLFNLAVRALTALLLEDSARAAALLPLLEPHVGTHVVQATRLVYAGPVSFLVGGLRLLVGDVAGGTALLEQAVGEAERIESPPFVARAKLGLARAHGARGVVTGTGAPRPSGTDLAAATQLAREAEALAGSLGMARVAVRAAAAASTD